MGGVDVGALGMVGEGAEGVAGAVGAAAVGAAAGGSVVDVGAAAGSVRGARVGEGAWFLPPAGTRVAAVGGS